MRSLRNGRSIDVNKKKSENTDSKMCNKRSKPCKTDSRKARPVLADRTNSDLDTNSSSNTSTFSTITRPKRVHNLPAKFQNHEITPIKNYRPECSSTPLSAKNNTDKNTPVNVRTRSRNTKTTVKGNQVTVKADDVNNVNSINATKKIKSNKLVTQNVTSEESKSLKTTTPVYKKDMMKESQNTKKSLCLESNKVLTPLYKKKVALLEKPKIQTPDRIALYEFDFDPSEEPTQAKKKRIRKKAPSSKKTTKSNSDKDNADLKNLIEKLKQIQEKQKCKKLLEKKKALKKAHEPAILIPTINVENVPAAVHNDACSSISNEQNVECLSPIPMTSSPLFRRKSTLHQEKGDSLSNLLSDSPIASSSMIKKGVPSGSPWRVEGAVGIRKWPLNFHVKPSMTPSYDRDTVHVIGLSQREGQNFVPNENSHVYTNISINTSHGEEEPHKSSNTNWKQTSILSFYEESLKKSAKKRSLPTKKHVESYNFEELVPEKNELSNTLNQSEETVDKSSDQDKNKGTVDNCFGFDDSAEFDQENISPAKIPKLQNINTVRGRFKGTRKQGAVLKEINQINDINLPMRVVPSDIIQIIEKQKFMEDIEEPREEPTLTVLPEVNNDSDKYSDSDDEMIIDKETPQQGSSQDNEMELFAEPVEPDFIHFSKPTRRSYETRKKPQLTFLLPNTTKGNNDESDYDSEDDHVHTEKVKKVTKRKKKQNTKTKKEEKIIDEWAAGFNSMLEEVEDFALCVE